MRSFITNFVVIATLCITSFVVGYRVSSSEQVAAEAKTESVRIVVQEKINTVIQKVEVPSVVYREKIVTKYKTIKPKIESYDLNIKDDQCRELDNEFVSIFNESVKGVNP